MGHLDYKYFSERRRPHIHPPGATLFVTFRLAGSVPQATVRAYRAEKEWLEDQLKRARKLEKNEGGGHSKGGLERLEQSRRQWVQKFEDVLHQAATGPMWMKNQEVADIVAKNINQLDGEAYLLDAYCVMSNHVHVVFTPLLTESELKEALDADGHLVFTSENPGLSRIMQLLKGRSARDCNRSLSRTGQFWEHESFDHVVRKGRLDATIKYVLNNP